jgi:ubiquinone/menaquinone biosynthesis C-methylase UbiE
MADDAEVVFNDAVAYERFMGRWSRAAGEIFLDWVVPPKGARWLDVGCGTGVFTHLVLETCAPEAVVAIDSATAQIDYARELPVGRLAMFHVADAQALPFPDRYFDVITSALVLNFIPDRRRALTEMHRVGRRRGVIAAYVWDFAAGRATSWPLTRGMRQIGMELPKVPGSEDSSIETLRSLFERAGFEAVTTRPIDVSLTFTSFEDFWHSQISPFTPNGKAIATLREADRAKLVEAVRAILPDHPDGSVAYSTRANAVKGRVPAL